MIVVRLDTIWIKTQDARTGDDHAEATVWGFIGAEGEQHKFSALVKQTVGTSANDFAVEVEQPKTTYRGPFNQRAFARVIEEKYRAFVKRFRGGLRVRNGAQLAVDYAFTLEAPEGSAGW